MKAKISYMDHDLVSQSITYPLLVKNNFVPNEYRLYTNTRDALIIVIENEKVTSISVSESCVLCTDSRFSRILNSRITFKI